MGFIPALSFLMKPVIGSNLLTQDDSMGSRLNFLPPPQADRRDFFLHLESWFEGEVEVAMEPHSSLWSKLFTESELLLGPPSTLQLFAPQT